MRRTSKEERNQWAELCERMKHAEMNVYDFTRVAMNALPRLLADYEQLERKVEVERDNTVSDFTKEAKALREENARLTKERDTLAKYWTDRGVTQFQLIVDRANLRADLDAAITLLRDSLIFVPPDQSYPWQDIHSRIKKFLKEHAARKP